VAIALPVPSHIVDISTLFSSSNLLLNTSSNPVSQVEVVVARRSFCGADSVEVGAVVETVVGVVIFPAGACWTQPVISELRISTKIIFVNRVFIS
jgi:hypothetical protein